MAIMSHMIRKASATVAPRALRAVSSPIRFLSTGSDLDKEISKFESQFPLSAADQKLSQALKLQIKSSEGSGCHVLKSYIKSDEGNYPPKPTDFPFKIEEHNYTGNKFAMFRDDITLKREFEGEKIEVRVCMPKVIDKEGKIVNNETEKSNASPGVPLQVKIYKKDRTFMAINVFACANEIFVKEMSLSTYEPTKIEVIYYKELVGPKFEELTSDVQDSLKEFLEVRGINTTNAEFLINYMVQNPNHRYMKFLKELENFVKK